MDAATYPSAPVREILTRNTVPVRLDVMRAREEAKRLRAVWTPTFLYLSADGREFHRSLGYLPPEEFTAQVLLGTGLAHFQEGRFDAATAAFEESASRFSATFAAPECLYWKGVCGFKTTRNLQPIYDACQEIVKRYPRSEWATKVGFVSKYADFNLAKK